MIKPEFDTNIKKVYKCHLASNYFINFWTHSDETAGVQKRKYYP